MRSIFGPRLWSLSDFLIWQQINDVDPVKQLEIWTTAYLKEKKDKKSTPEICFIPYKQAGYTLAFPDVVVSVSTSFMTKVSKENGECLNYRKA